MAFHLPQTGARAFAEATWAQELSALCTEQKRAGEFPPPPRVLSSLCIYEAQTLVLANCDAARWQK